MSSESYKVIECPHCHEKFEAKFWSVVRGDIDISIKDLIINEEFNLLMCPNCNKIFSYEENFIYMDPEEELFVIVMPEYYRNQDNVIEKLKSDYMSIKNILSDKKELNMEPEYLFGADKLREILLDDMNREEESEVISFICAEKNYRTKKIKKNFARKNKLPIVLPYKNTVEKDDVLLILDEILNEYPKLTTLKTLAKLLSKTESARIEFIEDEDKTT
jgi:hypothetical protein